MEQLNSLKNAVIGNSQRITVGPVIGNVFTSSARILAEFALDGPVTLELQSKSDMKSQKVEAKQGRPVVFVFQNLKPGQMYTINFQSNKVGSFSTVSNDKKTDFNFALISCNSVTVLNTQTPEKQMWTGLKSKIQNKEIDYLIHIGDQVYMDYEYWNGDKNNAYGKVEAIVSNLKPDDWAPHLEDCREILRQEYRKTWQNEATSFCLAHAPSVMILDDHEIVDDCGRNPELQDPKSWKSWYSSQVARYVYYEYQKQLSTDVDFNNLDSITQEFQQFVIKNTGFFVLDQRAHFLWHGDVWKDNTSIMGKKQREAFNQALSKNGLFKNCKSIFIINSVPLVMFTQRITKLASYAIDDFKDHWMYSHKNEVLELLDALRVWQTSQKHRVATILGGDVHFGGHYDIYYRGKPFLKQLIASSMGQKLFPRYAKFLNELGAEVHEDLSVDYTFEKHDFIYENNFGQVNIKEDSKGHLVQMKLITNKYTPIKEDKTWTNRNFVQGNKSTCCQTF